jgi:hypothetical protein
MELAFPMLHRNQQKGSKPRCHLLTKGTDSEVAARLTSLIEPWGKVRLSDHWMPSGFERCAEAQLASANELLPDLQCQETLRDWWLAISTERTATPNIDLASTCLVRGKEGLLLVEAKAHDAELRNEERGKPLKDHASDDSQRNHEHIDLAIRAANASLSVETKLRWSLSRDSHYQMSNRFAWAWKLTEIGIPVILAYLGFIGCEEMRKGDKQRPISSEEEWEEMLRVNSRPLFPGEVWNREWCVHGQSLIPIIRTSKQALANL